MLRNVEAALSTAAADISSTTASVTAVIIKLDTSIAQIKADAAAAAAAVAAPVHQLTDITSSSSGSSGSNVPADATAPAGGDSAVRAPDGSVVQSAAAGGSDSSAIVPHGAGTAAAAGGDHPPEQQQQQPAGVMPPALVLPTAGAAGTGGKAGSGTSSDAYARANEMARELGQALGAFGKGAAGANLTLTAGRSLEQVGLRSRGFAGEGGGGLIPNGAVWCLAVLCASGKYVCLGKRAYVQRELVGQQ